MYLNRYVVHLIAPDVAQIQTSHVQVYTETSSENTRNVAASDAALFIVRIAQPLTTRV